MLSHGVMKYTASKTIRIRLSVRPAMAMRVGSRVSRALGVMRKTKASIRKQAPIWLP